MPLYRKTAAVLAVISVGAHWFVLQAVAWLGMLVSFSATDGLASGIQKTFDGEHPCPLCHVVEKGLASEQNDGDFLIKTLKLDLGMWPTPVFVACRPCPSERPVGLLLQYQGQSFKPPLPPPRIEY